MKIIEILKAGFKTPDVLLDTVAKLFDETENKQPDYVNGEYIVTLDYASLSLIEKVDVETRIIKRQVNIEITDLNYIDSLLEFMLKVLPKIKSSMVVPCTEIEIVSQVDISDSTHHQFLTIRFFNGSKRKNRKVLSMCSASVHDNHNSLSNFSVSYVLK